MTTQRKDLDKIAQAIRLLIRSETWLSVLYQTCSRIWPDERGFWRMMEISELSHAKNLEHIADIVSKKPHDFSPGIRFNTISIETMIDNIKQEITRLRENRVDKRQFIKIAADLEDSLIENRYFDVVESRNVEFQSIIKKIKQETASHRSQLQERLKDMESNPNP